MDDIEKGHTLRRVAMQRRPRLSSLPRGPGSWWTSTESLCSNASGDSRHSAYSYCGRGFYPQYGALETRGGFNPRVERTLLDARRRLEDQAATPAGLGSLTPVRLARRPPWWVWGCHPRRHGVRDCPRRCLPVPGTWPTCESRWRVPCGSYGSWRSR